MHDSLCVCAAFCRQERLASSSHPVSSGKKSAVVPESVGGFKSISSPMKSVIDYSWHLRSQSRQASTGTLNAAASIRSESSTRSLNDEILIVSPSLLKMKSSIIQVALHLILIELLKLIFLFSRLTRVLNLLSYYALSN